MAVRIRLTRVGATKQPTYRLVVADSRRARDSRAIDTIGHYNPRTEPIELNVDEVSMMVRISTEIDGSTLRMDVSGGAFEDQRKARVLDPDRTRLALGTHMTRARDRMDPAWADAPTNDQLTVQQSSAWDTYTEGRLARHGLAARPKRRIYHFRLRHGFADTVDNVFHRLWNAEGLGSREDWLEPRIIEEAPVGGTIGQEPAKAEILDRAFELVCCRNVLIYWSAPVQVRLLANLCAALAPGGYLCLGEAEWPLPPAAAALVPIAPSGKIFRAAGRA